MCNLGPRCAEWLAEIGFYDESDFRAIVNPHRMILYALGGALLDMDCNKLPNDIKRSLVEEVSVD